MAYESLQYKMPISRHRNPKIQAVWASGARKVGKLYRLLDGGKPAQGAVRRINAISDSLVKRARDSKAAPQARGDGTEGAAAHASIFNEIREAIRLEQPPAEIGMMASAGMADGPAITRIKDEIIQHEKIGLADTRILVSLIDYARKAEAKARDDRGGEWPALEAILENFRKHIGKAAGCDEDAGRNFECLIQLNGILRSENVTAAQHAHLMKAIRDMSGKTCRKEMEKDLGLFYELATIGPHHKRMFEVAIRMIGEMVRGRSDGRERNGSDGKSNALLLLRRITLRRGFSDEVAGMLGQMWKAPSQDAYWDTYVLDKVLGHGRYSGRMLPAIRKAVEGSPYPSRWRLDPLLRAMDNPAFEPAEADGLLGAICRISDIVQTRRTSVRSDSFFYFKAYLAACTALDAACIDALAKGLSEADSHKKLDEFFGAQEC
jgi:hypothetical protein